MAEAVLARPDASAEARAVAERALGLAAVEQHDLARAERHLRRAVRLATAAGLPRRVGEARMSLSTVLALAGRTTAALRQAERARPLLDLPQQARLHSQRAWLLQRLGRVEEALAGYRAALTALTGAGDDAGVALVLLNRGVVHAYRGDHAAAEADFADAERRYQDLGLQIPAAEAHHNRGWLAMLGGDVPAALTLFDEAERRFAAVGAERLAPLLDRAEAFLTVRLLPEARRLAQRAAQQLERAGMQADLADARLLGAQAALLAGDAGEARHLAALAEDAFRRQGRRSSVLLARYTSLRAEWQAGRLGEDGLQQARRLAAELEARGWAGPAADTRLIAARLALDHGLLSEAEVELAAASTGVGRGPVDVRARAWHAAALLRLARGDRPAALSALRAGLRLLEEHRATLGATELRVHASARAEELATLGLRLALAGGRPAQVLGWSERYRVGSLRLRPARPPADRQMAADLASLRRVVAEMERAALDGHGTNRLLRRQAAIEAAVRRRTFHTPGGAALRAPRPPALPRLRAALGEAALVSWVESDGQLHAVTLAGGGSRFHRLGEVGQVAAELASLRFALSRLTRPHLPGPSRAAASSAASHAAATLDRLLLGPLAEVDGRPLVAVPGRTLAAVPWAALPSCRGRPVVVAPSAAAWLSAGGDPGEGAPRPGSGRTVLVAGPDLEHGDAEVAELAAVHPHATVLTGRDATVDAVLAALDGAGLAHVAAHGTFRGDNPLFSSLHLADGPLTVYDLERLDRAPRWVVLSACDAAATAVGAGDDVLGLAAALLSLGTRALVAPVLPVADAETRRVMRRFHRHLTAVGPAAALAAALADGGEEGTAGFVCLGAG